MKIDVRFDADKLRRELKLDQKQVPFATSVAINQCLKAAAPAVQKEMDRVFDRPTPWTRNSYRVLKFSNKHNLTGIVGFKDVDYKGGPGGRASSAAGVYLQPHMRGGARPAKALERLLRSRGLIGNNEFLVPSKFQRLDAYGNVPKGVVQKVLANLQANFDRLNNTPSRGARGGKKKADYFFTRRGVRGARMTAIWQNFGTKGKQNAIPAFIVVSGAPVYKKVFDQEAVVQREVNRRFKAEFELAYARAIATPKP